MVYLMDNPTKMDDDWVYTPILGNRHMYILVQCNGMEWKGMEWNVCMYLHICVYVFYISTCICICTCKNGCIHTFMPAHIARDTYVNYYIYIYTPYEQYACVYV